MTIQEGSGPTPKRGGIVRYVPPSEPLGLDPIATTQYMTGHHAQLVYDFLFQYGNDHLPQPQMVDEWSVSPDRLTWTFTLRNGLSFHDGKPVDSEDVVLSLRRWAKKNSYGLLLAQVTNEWRTLDAKTFQLCLNEPFGLLLDALSQPTIPAVIMPKREAQLEPNEVAPSNIGSGPFKFAAWNPGASLSYVRNDEYQPRNEHADGYSGGKHVYIDGVEWRIMPEPPTKIPALEASQADFVDWGPPELYEKIHANPELEVFYDQHGSSNLTYLNKVVPPFSDVRARQALQIATNQKTYLDAAYPQNSTVACKAMFGCGTRWETFVGADEVGAFSGDLGKARELWDQVYNGRPIRVITPTDRAEYRNLALVTVSLLETLGAKVEAVPIDTPTFASLYRNPEATANGEWHIGHVGSIQSVDPVTHSGTNPSFLGGPNIHPRLQELKVAFVKATNESELRAIIDEYQSVNYANPEFIYLGSSKRYKAHRSDLKGVIRAPTRTYQVFWNMWFDR
ncbi:ABC transporter substrate-binding protein [Dehalococcoidia bacterium]|nr:ABC transporter substrate-binding protein [Dehalococcoidia bacterium]